MKLVSYDDLKQMGIPFTRRHLARLEAAGKFPRHVKLGPRTNAWVESEISQLLKQHGRSRHCEPK
jgi:prophage regulatory protein